MVDLSDHRLTNDWFPPDVLAVTSPLVAVTRKQAYPFGTAVFVAPYLAIAAKHVIDEFFRTADGIEPSTGSEAQFGIEVCQLLADGRRYVWWNVNQIRWLADIAWLELRPRPLPHDFAWPPFLAWNIAPPFVGAKLTAYGFPNTKVEMGPTVVGAAVDGGDEVQGFFIHGECAVSEGVVRAVYVDRRDDTHSPFPCLELAARYLGGMSGGPVLNEKRELVGLVCSDFTLEREQEDDPLSYVSLIYPALAAPLSRDLSRPDSGTHPALELATKGEIQVRHVEDFVYQTEESDEWQSFAINYDRRPGLPDSQRLRRVASEEGRTVLEASFSDGPVLTGEGHLNFTCPGCDAVLAANLYPDQVFDVCMRCNRCASLGTFRRFDERRRRVPIISLTRGTYHFSQPIPIPGPSLMVGGRPGLAW